MLNRIVLGTVQFGMRYGVNNSHGVLSEAEVYDILDFAKSKGITTLDTAAAYGDAEQIIGSYTRARNCEFNLITKAHSLSEKTTVLSALQGSLDRLQTRFVDTFMFHRSSDLRTGDHLEQAVFLKSEGLIDKIGVSIYDIGELDADRFGDCIDIVQLPFNILDSSEEKRTAVEKLSRNFEIHARSVFLQGLFFKTPASFPVQLESLKKSVVRIQQLAEEQLCHVAGLAARYVLSQDYISKIVIGVDSLSQLESTLFAIQNCNSSSGAWDELNRMDCHNSQLLNPQNWQL